MTRARHAWPALGLAVVFALGTAAGARAQEVTAPASVEALTAEPYTAGKASGPQVTLGEAVQLTLRHQPRIALAGHDVQAAAGRLREARGLFDTTIQIAPGMDYTQQPILPGFLKSQRDNRTLIQAVARQFTELNVSLRDILANSSNPLPRCPLDVNFGTDSLLLDGLDQAEVSVLGFTRDQFPLVNVDIENALGDFSLADFCTDPLGNNPLDAIRFELSYGRINDIDQGNQFGLGGVLRSGLEAPREAIGLLAEISEAVAARARLALERLGPLPDAQFQRSFNLQSGLFKPFRNGITASVELLLQSEERNFRDKILDPTFGGEGTPTRFPSNVTLGLDVPLGKGRGSASTAAAERSARFTLAARTEQTRHIIAEEVYRTLLAYLNLVAAQENLRLLQDSAQRQRTIAPLIDQRVKAGESARIEMDRARARSATVDASVATARAAIVDARVSLAEAAGLDPATFAEAPAATDRFVEVAAYPGAIEELLKQAIEARRDVRALEQARRAAAEIARGARADLRRIFDVGLRTGLANNYESELFRFLPDERTPIFSEIEPPRTFKEADRYYEPRGFYRSLRGRWEPFIIASLTVDFPFANNAAKGRLAQAQATLRSSEIQLADRSRVVGENVVGVIGSLRAAFDAVMQARAAVGQSQASLDGALSQLRIGELTLIDTLTTEEDLTRDQLELVRQTQRYLSTLARLRFETGQLVTFTGEGMPAESARFVPTDYVVR